MHLWEKADNLSMPSIFSGLRREGKFVYLFEGLFEIKWEYHRNRNSKNKGS